MAANKREVTIVGAGNWGSSLAAALESAQIPLREVITRKPRHSPLPTVTWKNARLDAAILWLCVPDAAIAPTAAEIVRRRTSLAGQLVLHSSGALTVNALDAAKRAGASVGSVHPAMTFPTRDVVPLKGVLFGIETEDAGTRNNLHALVRKLGGKPFDVSSQNKALYHAAGTLASPLLVSALTAAIEAAQRAGLDGKTAIRWVQSLAQPTLCNLFSRGANNSFSGPFARGDAETIRLHLRALEAHPVLATVYRSLAAHAVEALPVKNQEALAAVLARKAKKK